MNNSTSMEGYNNQGVHYLRDRQYATAARCFAKGLAVARRRQNSSRCLQKQKSRGSSSSSSRLLDWKALEGTLVVLTDDVPHPPVLRLSSNHSYAVGAQQDYEIRCGILLYNLATCCSHTGMHTKARRLFHNALLLLYAPYYGKHAVATKHKKTFLPPPTQCLMDVLSFVILSVAPLPSSSQDPSVLLDKIHGRTYWKTCPCSLRQWVWDLLLGGDPQQHLPLLLLAPAA